MPTDFDQLWQLVTAQFHMPGGSVHGPSHWRRVERNGLFLAKCTGADEVVVRLFALFHDSRRENDGYDTGHGTRGSWYARELRGSAYELSDERFELLRHACEWHTVGRHHDNPTIATCWDADRLDLNRVGITPEPKYMSTETGREIAASGDVERYIQQAQKT